MGFLMRAILVWLMSLVFFVGAVVAASLVLFACALNLPASLNWMGNCPTPVADARAAHLETLKAERSDLLRRISLAEADLAAVQCTALAPDPNRPLDPKDWQDRDVAGLYGCWDLSTDYQTRNVEHEDEVGYPAWQMCFDMKGNGQQIMRDMDGIACQGPVTGRFSQAGTLMIEEADNLPCGDGGYIHRREFTCTLAGQSVAQCATLQPETDGQMAVEFRRAARQI